jgi:hypothetical protein
VLEVQEETGPGGTAEVISGNSHVSKSSFIEVIADLLEASKEALSDLNDNLNSWVFTTCILKLLGDVDEDDSDKSYDSNDERSNGN